MSIWCGEHVKSSTNLSRNKMSISVYADDLTKLIAVYYIQGSMLKNGWDQIEIFFTVDKVYANLEIVGYVYNWEENFTSRAFT